MSNLAYKNQENYSLPFSFQYEDWRNKPFSNPNSHIRLATVFSGIGAIEQAMKRLKLNHEIIFAGDIDPPCEKKVI